MSRPLAVVILAAGKGTRMNSELPKALHKVCGRPMLEFLIDAAEALRPQKVVVVAGFGFERVREAFESRCRIVRQKELLGSGHAVHQAAGELKNFRGSVMVLYCDTPLLSGDTLRKILNEHRSQETLGTLLSVELKDPTSYGRVKKDEAGRVIRIVEELDASALEKAIPEINVGAYVFDGPALFQALEKVPRNPVKKEYYLTDAIEILAREGPVTAVRSMDQFETSGINTRRQLAWAEGVMQEKILNRWIDSGVSIRDPRTTVIDAGVAIGAGTEILPHTVIEAKCVIGKKCVIGPFARLRGASRVADGAVIGNFVEIVRSSIGRGTQVKHLSYIGDASVGASVNVGAGTITANYDGQKKHRTVIKDGAQIGSGTVLIAPVTVGRGAKTAAGAVVTKGKNVPDRKTVAGVPARVLDAGKRLKGKG